MSVSTYVCTHVCMDTRTQACVCTPTRTVEQTSLLNSGFCSYKLGDFLQMASPLCASGSSEVHEGGLGTCFLPSLVRMKEVAPQTPSLGICLVQSREPVVTWQWLPSGAVLFPGLRKPVLPISSLTESALSGALLMPLFQTSYVRLGEVRPC